jgi:electron transport complex protein RnfC
MYTFKIGGVHPPEFKDLSDNKKIVSLSLPDFLFVGMSQHLGKPAKPVVKVKQEIRVGQLIGEADGFISANVHSPVSGIVKKIEKTVTALGSLDNTVIIEVDKKKTIEGEKPFLNKNPLNIDMLNNEEILNTVKELGIVGLGGATFPSNVKLSPPGGRRIEYLILNGAECEPYLTADNRLMLERAKEIIAGTNIIGKLLGVKKTFIGIEANKPDAIKVFNNYLKDNEITNIEVAVLKTKYPQGGEKQLIYAVTKREVPSGKLPLDVGCVVHNVGTVYAVYEALYFNKPLFERVVTVTGAVINPGNFKVKIGTPFSFVIEEGAKGFVDKNNVCAVINGGPMMGKAVRSINVPVLKGTSGILVLDKNSCDFQEQLPCIRCGKCVNVCPMGLMPTELAMYSVFKDTDKLADSMDCIECGSCSYICPSHRQLVHMIRIGKAVYRNRSKK